MTNRSSKSTYLKQQQNSNNIYTDEKLKYSNIILTNMLITSPLSNRILSETIKQNSSCRKRKEFIDNSLSSSIDSKRRKFLEISYKNSQIIQTDAIIPLSTFQSNHLLNNEEENLLSQINELHHLKINIQHQYKSTIENIQRCLKITRSLLIEKSQLKKRQAREISMKNRFRLGQYVTQRHGMTFIEQWIDGFEYSINQHAKEQLICIKENLDRQRKNFIKNKHLFQQQSSFDWCEYDEIFRLRQLYLKREEINLIENFHKLNHERTIHICELKRLFHEDHSYFNQNNILHHRYLLLQLIHKNHSIEIHYGFDLFQQNYVACKIYQLKQNLHQYQIHQQLNHKHIVKLYDKFDIDKNLFCIVMEYCDGNDLELILKQNQTIPEKEARSIIGQILNGLKYLNTEIKPAVIHCDLKPANILVRKGNQCGEIKITDFGLSKQIHDNDDGIDLSTLEMGTYWYLPPEVFFRHPNRTKLSSKIDVWSVGCIFYQCLYGQRPYGHNRSQSMIFEYEDIQFPNRPQVSNEAKAFIRRCLTYDLCDRPDVLQINEDNYFKSYSKRTTLTSSTTLFSPISL